MQKHGFNISDVMHRLTRPGIVNPRGLDQVQNKKRCLILPIPMPAAEDVVETVGELGVAEEAAAEEIMHT